MDRNLLGSAVTMIILKQAVIGYSRKALFPPLTGHFTTGSLTAVVGVNGAGKSTLLKTLAGLHSLQGGRLTFSGHQAPSITYLPQKMELDRQFPIRVSDLVAMGHLTRSGMFSGFSKYALRNIDESLERVGMTSMVNSPIGELSDGQLQRVCFARLLVCRAELILLDEPFASIDSPTIQILVQVIKKLHQQGRTLITVLHDMSLVAKHFSQILLLSPKKCYWGASDFILKQISSLNFSMQSDT